MKRMLSARGLGLAGILIIASGCSRTVTSAPVPTTIATSVPTATAAPVPTTTATPPAPKPLDVVADRGFDFNGIPLNPRWGYQRQGQQLADARQLCPDVFLGPGRVNPNCTSQRPAFDGSGIGASLGWGGILFCHLTIFNCGG